MTYLQIYVFTITIFILAIAVCFRNQSLSIFWCSLAFRCVLWVEKHVLIEITILSSRSNKFLHERKKLTCDNETKFLMELFKLFWCLFDLTLSYFQLFGLLRYCDIFKEPSFVMHGFSEPERKGFCIAA